MKKTNSNLIGINMVFVVALVISNVVTAKLFATGINLFGTALTLPGAALCYAITFLATDVIGEIWGKKEANRTVRWGFVGQVIATLLIILTQYLPAADPEAQTAYERLLGQNWIFVIGSMVAYFASQSWDVFFFHKIRDKFIAKHGSTDGGRWIWNNASTMTSQIIDTVLFIGISFGIGFGWFFDRAMWPSLFAMMLGQYALKFILAALDTPFFYLLTRRKEGDYDCQEESAGLASPAR
ncbi:MAG: queuosine precursor transporter [Acidaminococcaceae bacterium]|nr:queuosine precursor transporter [Acidaminococcaceae bacterium]